MYRSPLCYPARLTYQDADKEYTLADETDTEFADSQEALSTVLQQKLSSDLLMDLEADMTLPSFLPSGSLCGGGGGGSAVGITTRLLPLSFSLLANNATRNVSYGGAIPLSRKSKKDLADLHQSAGEMLQMNTSWTTQTPDAATPEFGNVDTRTPAHVPAARTSTSVNDLATSFETLPVDLPDQESPVTQYANIYHSADSTRNELRLAPAPNIVPVLKQVPVAPQNSQQLECHGFRPDFLPNCPELDAWQESWVSTDCFKFLSDTITPPGAKDTCSRPALMHRPLQIIFDDHLAADTVYNTRSPVSKRGVVDVNNSSRKRQKIPRDLAPPKGGPTENSVAMLCRTSAANAMMDIPIDWKSAAVADDGTCWEQPPTNLCSRLSPSPQPFLQPTR